MKDLLAQGRHGERIEGLEIVDMHGHLGVIWFPIPETSPASLVAVMDRVGISSVVCSHMRCMSPYVSEGNAAILQAMRDFPGRILGYVSLWPFSAEAVAREVEQGFRDGFTGVKIHNANGFPYTHEVYEPAYQLASDLRRPVLFHTWGQESVFDQVRVLAARYPGAAFLLGHSGCTNEAGYAKVAGEFDNVFLEICTSAAPRGLLPRFIDAVGVEKVVWGSDVYFMSQTQQIGRVLGARIPESDKRAILSGNALRILGYMKPV